MSAGFLMYVGKCSLEMKPFQAKGKQRNLHKQSPATGRGACSKHGRARAHVRLQRLRWEQTYTWWRLMVKMQHENVQTKAKSGWGSNKELIKERGTWSDKGTDSGRPRWNVPAASQNHISLVRERSHQPAGSPANSHFSLLVKVLRINCPANSG